MNSLWDILSVAIGISFVFMILSILNSWIQDYIATVFHLRAHNLADIIQNLLEPGAEKLNGTKRALADLFPVFLGDPAGESTAEGETSELRSGFDRETLFVPYIAETGDTLSKVAKKHKVSGVNLQAANPDALDRTPLPEGMTLSIPYAVKPGGSETLSSIAAKFQIETAALLASNPDVRDKLPQPEGSTVSIQSNVQAMAMDTLNDIAETFNVPTPTLVGANLEALYTLPLPDGLTLNVPYPVKPNTADTLSSLAEKADMSSAAALRAANPQVLDSLPLSVGSTLNIPHREAKISQLDNRSRQEILFKLRENPVMTLYTHPVVYSLSKPGQLPDNLPTNDFTVALLDLLDDAGRAMEKSVNDVINMRSIIEGIRNLEAEEKQKDEEENQLNLLGVSSRKAAPKRRKLAFRLRSLLYAAQLHTKKFDANGVPLVGVEEFQQAVSEWFDDTVARGRLWYKRRMQRIGILCGFALAIAVNADTIGIANSLWQNAILRESVVQAAQASASQGQVIAGEQAKKQLKSLMDLGLPLGWSFDAKPAEPTDPDAPPVPDDPRRLPETPLEWIGKIAGLLLTGFAISQGSQIWFDLMNRLLNLRSSALQPASEEHPAKDKK